MNTKYETLTYSVENRTAIVTLNRPERMNALTARMETELREAMEMAGQDAGVRVIVLTGNGRAFCAGMDIDELSTLASDDIRAPRWTRPFAMERRADYQSRYGYFPALPKPVICAINGAAAGLGLVFALYSDIRFASETAVFSTAFARRGLIAEHGIGWILPRVVGSGAAADLLLSSRRVTAEEAARIRLVDRIVPAASLMEVTLEYARELTDLVSPRSLQVIKRQLWESPFQTLAEATALANKEMELSFQSEDFAEGVRHFAEKRAPNFTGR